MSELIPIHAEGGTGLFDRARAHAGRVRNRIRGQLCMFDARLRTVASKPEEGAATAEYAVVLVAATGFAALLVTIMKSETVRKMLLDIVKQALSIGG